MRNIHKIGRVTVIAIITKKLNSLEAITKQPQSVKITQCSSFNGLTDRSLSR